MAKRLTAFDRDNQIDLFHIMGREGFIEKIVNLGLSKALFENYKCPELDILDNSEGFMALYRRTGEEEYLLLSNALRKAAHIVYRKLLKRVKDKRPNYKFLTLVA